MQGMRRSSRSIAGLMAVLATTMCLMLSACGSDKQESDPALQSTVTSKFKIVEAKGDRHLVGHGIVLTMPASWTGYGQEFQGTDGSTWEYAVGQPESTQPLPAGLQFSMGIKGKGVQLDEGMAEGARDLASLSPGYKKLDEGKTTVANAKGAEFLRFERELDYQGTKVKVEQVSLFIEVSKGITSTIRFIAPVGDWDKQLKAVYDSVKVAVKDS